MTLVQMKQRPWNGSRPWEHSPLKPPRKKSLLESNPELGTMIAQYIAKGLYFETACARAGVYIRSGRNWLSNGRKDLEAEKYDTPYAQFVLEIEEAEAIFEERVHSQLDTAAAIDPKAWGAAAWRLERRMPNRYGRQDKTQLQLSGGMAVGVVNLPDSLQEDLDTPEKIDAASKIGEILSILSPERGTTPVWNDSDEWQDSIPAAFVVGESGDSESGSEES